MQLQSATLSSKQARTMMTLEEYKRRYEESHRAPGWEAIDLRANEFYSDQQPEHFAAGPHAAVGGDDPLDGISLYESNAGGAQHYHFVTYGFSELYFDERAFGKDFSKFGFELTFRLKPYPCDKGLPFWALDMLQNIARYVFKSGNWFEPFHVMTANGPIRLDTDTQMCAFLFVPDPQFGVIQTPHGRVEFLQVFGITESELQETEGSIEKTRALAERHQPANPFYITDLERRRE
jgi:hypothetical protein